MFFLSLFSKWRLIALAGIAIAAVAAYFYVSSLQSSIQLLEARNAVLLSANELSQKTIDAQRRSIENMNKTIVQRDREIESLERALDGVMVDLKPDAKDPAPESVQQVIERLRNAK